MRLRAKDIDFDYSQINVRDGKGHKDRIKVLPENLKSPLKRHLQQRRALHEGDLKNGKGSVKMTMALKRKYPNAQYDWKWQYVFAET